MHNQSGILFELAHEWEIEQYIIEAQEEESHQTHYEKCLSCGAPGDDMLGGIECWKCYEEH